MSETALAVVQSTSIESEESPSALMGRAKDVASVCREIVLRTATNIQGHKYLRVEGWCALATAYGCVPSIREVVEEDRSFRAVAELRRSDGTVVAVAEGYCGVDEPMWANRAVYARRAMAQTRAISRVCRTAFAFCVVLIDENLQTTPAEEIPQAGESVVDAPRASPTRPPPAPGKSAPVRSQKTRVRFGKSKGRYLDEIDQPDLDWQRAAAQKSVDANDPKWHASNVEWLQAVDAEVARRAQ